MSQIPNVSAEGEREVVTLRDFDGRTRLRWAALAQLPPHNSSPPTSREEPAVSFA